MNQITDELQLLKDGNEKILPSTVIQNVPVLISVDISSTEEELLKEAEKNLRQIVDFGQMAIQNLSDLASQTEHPRPYEALASLIKSVTDSSVALASLRKTNKGGRFSDDRHQNPEDKGGGVISASVADLLDEIDNKRRNEN